MSRYVHVSIWAIVKGLLAAKGGPILFLLPGVLKSLNLCGLLQGLRDIWMGGSFIAYAIRNMEIYTKTECRFCVDIQADWPFKLACSIPKTFYTWYAEDTSDDIVWCLHYAV